MRRALLVFVAVAIVVLGCAKAPTPDEAYLLYMGEVNNNEMQAYNEALDRIFYSTQEGPWAPWAACVWVNNLENATKGLKNALERAPKPLHPALKKSHEYALQAMEHQLDGLGHFDKGCASMEADEILIGVDYQNEAAKLLVYAGAALAEYYRSQ